MFPVPLAVDLTVDQVGAPWPPFTRGLPADLHVWSLNAALSVCLGAGGWSFEWESVTDAGGVWRVPAFLEPVTVDRCPGPGDGGRARVTARAMLRTRAVPRPGERGNLGRLIATRLEGAVWRYRLAAGEGVALISVEGVRLNDHLRAPVELLSKSQQLVAG